MGLAKVIPLGEDLAAVHHGWYATFNGADGVRSELPARRLKSSGAGQTGAGAMSSMILICATVRRTFHAAAAAAQGWTHRQAAQ